jgi:type I restriction-modification system DNA methylase subunit
MEIDVLAIINKFKGNCNIAKNEEEIRVNTNILLDNLSKFYSLDKKTLNEVSSIQGGRADSIYSDIIFEFKSPKKFNSKKGINEALFGKDDKDRGLFTYLVNFSLDELGRGDSHYFENILLSKVGIAFDGNTFIFFRFKRSIYENELFIEKKTKSFPANIGSKRFLDYEFEVVKDFDLGIKKLLLYLRSTKRKRLSSENFLSSFSSSSKITKESILYLNKLFKNNINTNSRINTLFKEWNRIFGEIYGEEETDFTQFTDELIKMYSLPKDIEIRSTLFVIQTYYSIVIKLLIHNLLESLTNPTKNAEKPRYKYQLTSLFSGNHHTDYYINNFFEIHYFEWFILAEDLKMDFINNIITELDTFETTASVIKPEIVGDVLKKVYLDLIPRSLRHLMGEYYTPDWLVDFTIEKSKYDFGLDTTILDPTCGSGSFLTHIIKKYIEKHKLTLNQNQLISKITQNIVGFDINPITVISAKANYILALGDITQLEEEINIPIYMCDSILVPTVHAKQEKQKHTIEIETVVGTFEIPVFDSRENNDYFLKTASNCILKDYTTFDEFHELIKHEKRINLSELQIEKAKIFYDKLYNLHLGGKNGFWPIILKNSFAPLFSQSKFDVIIGNPPWISWKSMSDTYRKATLGIWLSYGIFEKSAYDKITSHDDFAMAVTYVCIDHYLKDNGITAFILPQTFVKSLKGGEGFRKFEITRDNLSVPFSIIEVYDMVDIKPFAGEASNRTSVYIFEKNKKMIYPMDSYYKCVNRSEQKVSYDDTYNSAIGKIGFVKLSAQPINEDIRSPWLTVKSEILSKLTNFLGQSPYKGRKGIEPCGAKGIYLVDIEKNIGSDIKIKNLIERSRLKKAKELGVYPGIVEKDLVFPMVGGRNIEKWGIKSYIYIVVPHSSTGEAKYRGIDENILKTRYKKTYDWLFYFKDLLLETRIRSAKFFDKDQFPFYRLDNVGDYTYMPYKVLWREQSKEMTATVVSSVKDEFLGDKIVVCDSKVLYVSFDNELEAYYLCGILNSRMIGDIIEAYTIDTQRGVDIVKNINIPKFERKNKLHRQMANYSKEAHSAYTLKEDSRLREIENEIEKLIMNIFN